MRFIKTFAGALFALAIVFAGSAFAEVNFQKSQTANPDQIVIIGQLPDEVKNYIPTYFSELGLQQDVVFSDQVQVNIESNLGLAEQKEIAPTQLFNNTFKLKENQVILLGQIPADIQKTIRTLVSTVGVEVDLVFANSVRAGATFEVIRNNLSNRLFAKHETAYNCHGSLIGEGTARYTGDRETSRVKATIAAKNNWRGKARLLGRDMGLSEKDLELQPEFRLISCSSSERLKTMTCKVSAEFCEIKIQEAACN